MRRLLGLLAVTALVAAACGDSDGAATTTTTRPAATTTTSQPPPPTTAPPTGSDAIATASSALGVHLVDGAGVSLYVFMPDAQGDSVCYDSCEQTWPVFGVTSSDVVYG